MDASDLEKCSKLHRHLGFRLAGVWQTPTRITHSSTEPNQNLDPMRLMAVVMVMASVPRPGRLGLRGHHYG